MEGLALSRRSLYKSKVRGGKNEMPSFISILRTLAVVGPLVRGVAAGNVFEQLYGGVPKGWTFVRTPGPGQSCVLFRASPSSTQNNLVMFYYL